MNENVSHHVIEGRGWKGRDGIAWKEQILVRWDEVEIITVIPSRKEIRNHGTVYIPRSSERVPIEIGIDGAVNIKGIKAILFVAHQDLSCKGSIFGRVIGNGNQVFHEAAA